MNIKAIVILISITYVVSGTNGQDQLMMCKAVESTSIENVEQEGNVRYIQGPTGRRGPRGIAGEKGDPGPDGIQGLPGIVDYSIINDMLEGKLKQKFQNLESENEELRENLTAMQEELGELRSIIENLRAEPSIQDPQKELLQREVPGPCPSGLLYVGKCFKIYSGAMNYDQASDKCTNVNASMAKFSDSYQQSDIVEFFRRKLEGTHGRHLWTGMIFRRDKYGDHKIQTASWTTIRHRLLGWRGGFPFGPSEHLALDVGNSTDTSSGLWNKYDSYNMDGVLCETSLE